MTKLTACGKLAENTKLANDAAKSCRDAFKETPSYRRAQNQGYYEGEAAAYNDAYSILKREIERLQNKFQNGSLCMDDFNTQNEAF